MAGRARIIPRYTYDDYILWEGRWEIIDGIAHSMSPSPSPRHQEIAGKLHAAFLRSLENTSCTCKVYQPVDLKIDEHTVLMPDILVVCSKEVKQPIDFPPNLVGEILSPSTRLKDLIEKHRICEEFGIKYYLVVDPDEQSIKLFEMDSAGIYKQKDVLEIEIEDDCLIRVEFEKVW